MLGPDILLNKSLYTYTPNPGARGSEIRILIPDSRQLAGYYQDVGLSEVLASSGANLGRPLF